MPGRGTRTFFFSLISRFLLEKVWLWKTFFWPNLPLRPKFFFSFCHICIFRSTILLVIMKKWEFSPSEVKFSKSFPAESVHPGEGLLKDFTWNLCFFRVFVFLCAFFFFFLRAHVVFFPCIIWAKNFQSPPKNFRTHFFFAKYSNFAHFQRFIYIYITSNLSSWTFLPKCVVFWREFDYFLPSGCRPHPQI